MRRPKTGELQVSISIRHSIPIDSLHSGINNDGLKNMLYNWLKGEVRDEQYRTDWPEDEDELSNMAVRINNR